MRRFVRLFQQINLSRSLLRSWIFRSLLASGSTSKPNARQDLHREVFLPVGSFFFFVVLQDFFPFVPLMEGEEVLKVSCLPRSRRWEVYSGGSDMFGSPSAPMSGLSQCSSMVTGCHSDTSHICCWNFRLVPQVSV